MRNEALNRTEPLQLLALALPTLAVYLVGKAGGQHDVAAILLVAVLTIGLLALGSLASWLTTRYR